LIKITDPDGTSRASEYDAGHHIVAEVDKRGGREQTFYDFADLASRSIRKDGSELKLDPIQVQGLYEPNRTNDPLNAPVAFRLGETSSTYVDANKQGMPFDQRPIIAVLARMWCNESLLRKAFRYLNSLHTSRNRYIRLP
jgi:YD repeat-containing protein